MENFIAVLNFSPYLLHYEVIRIMYLIDAIAVRLLN